ncbi:Nonribosomal peptide synthetase [Aspergillus melleus]|uniref:Nonribosomal peptide synthetase n=1 Tax=Aspergillus melleus TaxID=138277 RepID=A0ACC3B8P7_9EURO|nr:Nonribosomal peptide synthetase [Aspergillus melleus]
MHIFDCPTPHALAKQVDDIATQEQYASTPRVPRDQDAEQFFAQNRLWFLEQPNPRSASYLMPIGLRIHGRLQLDALEQALQAIESRHGTLRTTHSSLEMVVMFKLSTLSDPKNYELSMAAHYRLTGAADATIGTLIANRGRAELEGLIGLFVNAHCIRTQLDDADSFEALVKQVQSTTQEALAHQDVSFERIVSVL